MFVGHFVVDVEDDKMPNRGYKCVEEQPNNNNELNTTVSTT